MRLVSSSVLHSQIYIHTQVPYVLNRKQGMVPRTIGHRSVVRAHPTLSTFATNDIYTIRWDNNGNSSGKIEFQLGKPFKQHVQGSKFYQVETVVEAVDGRLVESQDHTLCRATVGYEVQGDSLNLVYRSGDVTALRHFRRR